MSFQAYLDTIQKKTGKGPEDFRKLAEQRGYLRADVKASEIVEWLKAEFGLGHGHAMALYGVLRSTIEEPSTEVERLGEHFKGGRAQWNDTYRRILDKANAFGKDKSSVKVGDSYLSLLRNGKKYAIIKIGVDFLDLGIKLNKDTKDTARLQRAGDWNRMVTHRVRLTSPKELDSQVVAWLREAYAGAAPRSA